MKPLFTQKELKALITRRNNAACIISFFEMDLSIDELAECTDPDFLAAIKVWDTCNATLMIAEKLGYLK